MPRAMVWPTMQSVTARFGAKGSKLTAKYVAELRKQTSQ
jgi:hypothetical protein